MHSVSRLVVVVLVSFVAACGNGEPAADGEKSGYSPEIDEEGYPDCQIEFLTRDCSQACRHVNCCDPDITFNACMNRCDTAERVDVGGETKSCLASHILYKDEEGCKTVLRIYENYDDEDTCEEWREY